jgi:hypothetical protein
VAHQWLKGRLRRNEQPNFPELIAFAHGSLADALGAARGGSPEKAAEDLDRAVIWAFGIAWQYRTDLAHAINAKMAYNRQRNHRE